MILKNITIQNLGSITHLSHEFSDSLNIVKDFRSDELSFAIRLIFNHRAPPPPRLTVGVDTRIEATVMLSERTYTVIATPTACKKAFKLYCLATDGTDATREYLYLSAHSCEQDLSEVFCGDEDTALPRFLKYASEDVYYEAKELSRLTDGMSKIKAFRKYLHTFIKDFKPELLRDGKSYEIILDKNGRYAVRCNIDGSVTNMLSESERKLFEYLCFLRTAEFWRGFEELRNLHSIKKPLLVSGFLERLDEAIDVGELLERTENLNRQTILITNKDIERGQEK